LNFITRLFATTSASTGRLLKNDAVATPAGQSAAKVPFAVYQAFQNKIL